MINIVESDLNPSNQLSNINNKTWHIQFDSGSFTGYIADFKSDIISIKEDDIIKKYSGLRLFINLDKKNHGGYTIFVPYDPYFYFIPKKGKEKEVMEFLKKNKKIPNTKGIKDVKIYSRHIFGIGQEQFFNYRKIYRVILNVPNDIPKYAKLLLNHPSVLDCREYKVPFTIRCSLDMQLFCFRYYKFVVENGILRKYYPIDKENLPQLKTFTFDIEVRKKPIKKPQPDDPINVVGIKIGDKGFLINNIELTHFKIPSFWIGVDKNKIIRKFTKKEAEQKGWKYKPVRFSSINVENEEQLIKKFYSLIVENKPQSINGYASDFFDWPHFQIRGKVYGIDFKNIFYQDRFEGKGSPKSPNFFGDFKRDGVQMFDTMDWTSRDSYVSKGMQGLKSISKELLGIEAIEIDHEEQVRVWENMESHLLNPNHPDNKDPEKSKKNKYIAFRQSFDHAIYCASDVFVTDIFAIQSSLGLNIAVATKIPMNLFDVSRKKRGPMVESDLLNRMRGKMVAPNKVMKKSRERINPVKIKKKSKKIYKEVKKKIKGGDYKYWAECMSFNQMKKHCSYCKKNRCKDNWQSIWKLPINKQNPILCESESIENDPKNQKYYYPLENIDIFVADEKYEGALVDCFNPGVFKDNAKINFNINVVNFNKFKSLLHDALDRLIDQIESSKQTVKGYKEKVNVSVIEKEKLHQKIDKKFKEVTDHLEKRSDGLLYWRGTPIIIHVDVASMYPNLILNFNLQPYAITTKEMCEKCLYYPKEGDKQCWVDMKWNAVYKVMNISHSDQIKAEDYIQSKIEIGKEFEDNELVDIYKRYSSGSKKFNIYKFPVKTRFCQKSFKFFVNTVKNFRDNRYIYKYMMIDKEEEIDKIKSKYKEHKVLPLLNDFYNAVKESKEKFIKETANAIFSLDDKPELIEVTLSEILDAYEKGSQVNKNIEEMMQNLHKKYGEKEIPIDVKIKIDQLSIKKVFARNMQLGLKVLLNSFYGYLKSIGARFWSIEAAGATCLKGQEVIDFAVDLCENFACGINIELDTDGLWTALPSSIPLELIYKYKVKGFSKIYQDKFNLFNENLNFLIKKKFTNHYNYLPINNDGKVDLDIEYTKEWNKNRKWKRESVCEIKFDYEGPFSTLFVYTKKRMKVYKRDKKNPEDQKIDTITGLDELRKGELGLIRQCSKEITDAYKDGTSLIDCYKRACNVVNKYLKQLRNHTIDLNLILESRDLSDKTAPKVQQAYKEYQQFLKKYKIDCMDFPVFSISIAKKVESRPQWKEIWNGKKDGRRVIKQGILSKINRNPYSFAGFRTIDLGIPLETGDTVEWIIAPYPRVRNRSNKSKSKYQKEKKSQRAIPSKVFNGSKNDIKKNLEKWFGEPVKKTEMRDYVDWEFYIEKFTSMIDRYVIIPAKSQGIDVYKWLNINYKKKKVNNIIDISSFFHPLSQIKNTCNKEEKKMKELVKESLKE